jgi:hypothetical protein
VTFNLPFVKFAHISNDEAHGHTLLTHSISSLYGHTTPSGSVKMMMMMMMIHLFIVWAHHTTPHHITRHTFSMMAIPCSSSHWMLFQMGPCTHTTPQDNYFLQAKHARGQGNSDVIVRSSM